MKTRSPRQTQVTLAVVGIVLIALNLRPTITSLGALLDRIQDDIGMSGTVAGVATTMPVLAFAAVGAGVPALIKRTGLIPGVLLANTLLATGLILRAVTGTSVAWLLIWTAVATSGIAIANIVLPSLVSEFFRHNPGPVTGAYTMALQVGSSIGAGLTVPLAHVFGGWQGGLGIWAALAIVAAPPWLALLARNRNSATPGPRDTHMEAATGDTPVGPEQLRLWRNHLAWGLAVLFGMQALSAYVIMGWLPQIYRDAGLSAGASGALLAVVMAVAAPIALALPVIADRLADQRILVVIVTMSLAVGYVGLIMAPAAASWLWAVFLGIGSGAFPLALGLISLRSRTSASTTALSAFAQSTGYVLAAGGPVLVGALHQITGSWLTPLGLLLVLLVPQMWGGLIAGQDRYLDD